MEQSWTEAQNTLLDRLLRAKTATIFGVVAGLISALVTIEWNFGLDISLGVLYVLPVVLAGTKANRFQIVCLALLCAFVRGFFTNPDSRLDEFLRFVMAAIAYSGTGLFVIEMRKNRQLFYDHIQEIELRREAEEQLRVLVQSSPAAIMTLDENACVLAANRSTYELLAAEEGENLLGVCVAENLPVLADALKMESPTLGEFRTEAQCWGQRRDGTVFVAQTWFSTYHSGQKRRLAAIAVDVSEEVRDREEQNLQLLLRSNRLLAGAVSHEVRNLCAAVSVVSSNLARIPGLRDNEDFRALESLIAGLSSLARYELRSKSSAPVTVVDVRHVLNRFHLISKPNWTEPEASLIIRWPDQVPPVLADPLGLQQVFLNLERNSRRAVASGKEKKLFVDVKHTGDIVRVRFQDTGPGLDPSQVLFQPFQPGATSTGLGLYISRVLLRSFGGDLDVCPSEKGACFQVELRAALPSSPSAAGTP